MAALLVAARVASWQVPFRQAAGSARQLGFDGLELDATGDFLPRLLSQTGRREIVQIVRSHELRISAVACVMRHGLDVPERQESRIAYAKDVLSLARDLGASTAIVPSGRITPDEPKARNWLAEAVGELGNYGARIGATVALELADSVPEEFALFLQGLDTGSLGLCLDPAALFVNGIQAADAIEPLQKWIRHVHARDARPRATSRAGPFVPLGEGDIDWMKLLAALDAAGYRGWFGIDEPVDRARSAIDFLRRIEVS